VAASVVPVVPDPGEMIESHARWISLRGLCVSWGQAQAERSQATAGLISAQEECKKANTLLREMLVSCGVCPTCGSIITERK
jgi:hypothetical protein